MKPLKTLKDFEMNKDFLGDNILRDEVKAEAVKWIKHFNKLETAEDMIYEKDWEKIFKHFFNLTEEDLEEQEE